MIRQLIPFLLGFVLVAAIIISVICVGDYREYLQIQLFNEELAEAYVVEQQEGVW